MSGPRMVAVVFLAVALAGCGIAGEGGAEPVVPSPAPALPTGPPSVESRFTPDIPRELRVTDPKDVRDAGPCDLLTTEQLVALDLDPQSAHRDDARNGPTCAWKYEDGSTQASIVLALRPEGAKLPDLYRLRDTFATFEILQIAGHPAIRADDRAVGECTLNVGITDEHLLVVNGYLDDRELAEPCATAREMAELILSNLPPKS